MPFNPCDRRQILKLPVLSVLPIVLLSQRALGQTSLPLTPSCTDANEPTPDATEGPFYTPDTPEKRDFRKDVSGGQAMTLTGFVLSPDCRPVANALVDLWHADHTGRYDNSGYRLRGHQFTDQSGRYQFETIMPAAYSRRTRHFHVKVRPPGGDILTTQLYFPDEPANAEDWIFNPDLVMRYEAKEPALIARFDFVVELAEI